MFRRHQILLPFMVAVELLVREGKMTQRECQLVSMELGGLDAQLDYKLREEDRGQRGNPIPAWISRKVSAIIDRFWIILPELLQHVIFECCSKGNCIVFSSHVPESFVGGRGAWDMRLCTWGSLSLYFSATLVCVIFAPHTCTYFSILKYTYM